MVDFEYILLLLLMVIGLGPLAKRWDVPLPILLVLGGMLFVALPLPLRQYNPDLIFLIFVPPLLYTGALTSSARDLKRYQQAISRLAIGCVMVTIAAVALVTHAMLPQLPWGVCIVLGAMVSPPDAAVTLAIARRLGLPRSVVTILEGETLFNDLIAFITYRMAITAVVVGSFSWWQAIPHLVLGAGGGVLVGYLTARMIVFLRSLISEPRIANTLSLLTPFAAYLPAEWVHCSGVLAVVTTGLYLGRVGPRIVHAQTRLQAQQMWDVTLFILNGLIFALIGIELGRIIGEFVQHWQTMRFLEVVAISLTVIVVRILWVIPAALVPSLLFRRRQQSPSEHPPWRNIAVVAWTGIRGGDTLVTALALPLVTSSGAPFPGREMVQTLAYGVILATLVVQGLSLRPLIRRLKFPRDESEKSEVQEARTRVAEAGVQRLMTMATQEKMPEAVVRQIRIHHHLRRHVRSGGEPQMENEGASILARHLLRINRDVLRAERDTLIGLRDTNVIADDVMRRLMRELDLEEVVMEREID